jgi:hypothetical protein
MRKIYTIVIISVLVISGAIVAQTRRTRDEEFIEKVINIEAMHSLNIVVRACDPDGNPIIINSDDLPQGATLTETYLMISSPDPNECFISPTYKWTVLPGQGSLNNYMIANPIYTPPDITTTQTFTLTVEISDNNNIITKTINVTVNNSNPVFLLNDDFSDGNYSGWTIVDEGTRQAPSAWSASTGIMVQNSNIYDGATGISDIRKLGTYAYYVGDNQSWSNYQVDLTIRSQDNDFVGVMFRYQNTNNYYRFSWSNEYNYRCLAKKQNGIFTILASDSVPYIIGTTYQVRIIANDSLLKVY